MSQGTVDGFLKDTDVTLAADSNLFVPSQRAVKTYVDNLVATSTPLSNIPISTYSTVQHLMNFSLSAGLSSGGNITVSGTANAVDVAAGTGFIRAVDSNVATLSFFNWAASPALSVPLNTTRYIGVDYNAGAPIVITKTSDDWDLDTQFPLGVVVNEGGTRYISAIPWIIGDNIGNIIERFDSLAPVSRDNRIGGLILANTGTRNIIVSSGSLLSRMSEFTIPSIDTSTSNTFDKYYRNGVGGFTKQSAQTQWNNSQYDNGTGVLAALTAGHYTSRWFYVMTDGTLAMQFGRNNDTTLATALNDGTPSSAPDRIVKEGLLIGRLIIQQGSNTPATTQTVFETNFSSSSVTSFSDLSGFATPAQGGTGVQNNDASTVTITGSFPTTLTITAPTSITLPTSGTLATLANNLGAFASTTSSQLAGVISDETGTGALVFANSPVLVTPNIGSATGSVSGNAGTATALQTARLINGVSFNGTADITNIAEAIHAAANKVTPVDADEMGLADSASSFSLKHLTWANLKATLKTYFDTLYSPIATVFTSTDQTITAAGALTLAHGLGVIPKHVHAILVCQVNDLNYTAGDLVPFPNGGQGTSQGYSCVVDATNLNIRFGSQANVFILLNKTTGAGTNITLASWKIRFMATASI